MTKGYLIANIQVHDEDGFETFKKMSGPIISEYGGKILVRNPKPEVKEGSEPGVAVVIEFESLEKARKFYESKQYTEAKAVRQSAANTNLILVEGRSTMTSQNDMP